jgi:hypothetical protein
VNVFLAVLLGWLALGFETGLKQTLSVKLGSVVGAPSFVIPLAVFIALSAPHQAALWACLALGFGMDLLAPRAHGPGSITVIGPYSIGMVLACQTILIARGLVFRRNPLTVMALSVPAALVCHICVCAMFTARKVLDSGFAWSAGSELLSRGFSSVLTLGTGLLLGLMLMPVAGLLGMGGGRAGRR